MKYYYTILSILFFLPLFGQENSSQWLKNSANLKIKPVIGLQLWSSYTMGAEKYNITTGLYEKVDNRLNFQIRRTRLGIKGQAYKQLKFNLTAALDLVGRDLLAGTEGGGNNGASPNFRIWNAWVQWKINAKSEAFNLTFGYFVPQIGRESITAALRSTSMEKSWSQNYLRRHLTGIGPGRAVGMNLGGLFYEEDQKVAISYDVGIFNPVFESYGGNSIGDDYAPLLVGRVAFHFGDPEFDKYTFGHKVNYFGKRKGLTLAIAGATQGKTDLFTQNQAFGIDLLFNWKAFNIDGEWTYIKRGGAILNADSASDFIVNANTGYARMSYNITMKNQFILEPVLMLVQFNGPLSFEEQTDALNVSSLSGREQIVNIGFNLYPNPDLKISLHYNFRNADAGELSAGVNINNYFYQSGVGAIHRGDWLGLGVVAIF